MNIVVISFNNAESGLAIHDDLTISLKLCDI